MTGSAARALLRAVRFYQRAISPAFPPRCRFVPTCSAYAAEAIELHGAGRGCWLGVRRLAKCAPWHPGGVDLVPPRAARTAGPGRPPQAAAQAPMPTPVPGTDEVARPGATPPAPGRSAQQEAGVA